MVHARYRQSSWSGGQFESYLSCFACSLTDSLFPLQPDGKGPELRNHADVSSDKLSDELKNAVSVIPGETSADGMEAASNLEAPKSPVHSGEMGSSGLTADDETEAQVPTEDTEGDVITGISIRDAQRLNLAFRIGIRIWVFLLHFENLALCQTSGSRV